VTGPAGRRTAKSTVSPLLCLAPRARRGPAEIDSKVWSAKTASSESVRGDRPLSVVLMIAGQASSVDLYRPRTLFHGMSRSWYATAPSMKISVLSPGLRANGLRSHSTLDRSISGMSRSKSSVDVVIAFALRGAPCGDDSGPRARSGGYHDEEAATVRPADDSHASISWLAHFEPPRREPAMKNSLSLLERDAVLPGIDASLPQVPVVPRHRGTIGKHAYPRLISC